MKALSVIGITKSGKTTTVENILRELKRRRFTAGSVKEIHYDDFAIDSEGTNTYRHMAAGAQLVTARGNKETDILYPRKLSVEEILGFYTQDYVIMEGVSDYNVPVMLCAHDLNDLKKHAENDYFKRVFAVSGLVTNQAEDNNFEGIPFINAERNPAELTDLIIEKVFDLLPDFAPECCNACGWGCRELCSRILKGISKRDECIILRAKVSLSIDGNPVKMVGFVQDILKDTVTGLASNLKGYKSGKKIEIIINN